ncbi:unnamed protein product [Peniophora sp. CBMAI 1063]|nr:unnamed protein product [Peniophora sp. CBMAI 1063]
MDEKPVAALIQQISKPDVDAKIDAVSKLQAEFEKGSEVPDTDAAIQALKACLRISNQHLQTATLSALPAFLPLILGHGSSRAGPSSHDIGSTSSAGSTSVDLYTIRQVLNAFLPQGGVLDRLGDARERPREKARESFVLIGGYAFRAGGSSALARSGGGKNAETPLQAFERFLRESGLSSKNPRVREQSVLALVEIRRAHHMFPLRPYLQLLVGTLEDGDATVRETARNAVVELFTGPGVTDAARSDLKSQMTKKGVRKGTVDTVLERIFSKNAAASLNTPPASEDGHATKEYIPPSQMLRERRPTAGSDTAPSTNGSRVASSASIPTLPRPASRARALSPPPNSIPPTPTAESSAEVSPVYIASSRDLEGELGTMFKSFEGKETEHNWASRDRAITRIRGMLKAEVHEQYPNVFLGHLKPIIEASLKTLASLRTTVVTNTTNMYNELATTLQSDLDPVVETMLVALLKMAGFTKKITAQSSQATVTTLLTYTTPSPRIVINALHNGLQDKTPQARGYIADHLAKYLDLHGGRIKPSVESGGLIDLLDRTLRKAVADSNPAARQAGRIAYWAFESIWPERALAILNAQDAANRKAIEKANPHPDSSTAPATSTAAPKKSSIAAAIAASRAKAKAIANAPPTLRHQATSAARTISPPKRSMSPSFSTGSVGSASGSPPLSPRSRIVSSSGKGTVRPAPAPRMSHSRTSSSDSMPSTSNYPRPASPMVVVPASPPRGTLRRAMQTALPGSPPATMVVTPPSPAASSRRYVPPSTAAQDRMSMAMPILDPNEESLLTAVAIPLPDDDSDNSDMDVDDEPGHGQPLSFSALDERYGPPSPSPAGRASLSRDNSSPSGRASLSRGNSSPSHSTGFSPKEMSNTLSTGTAGSVGSPPAGAPQPLVEDALRARAERAQSAADRLLELVDPPPPYLPSPPSSQTAHPALQSNAARMPGTPVRHAPRPSNEMPVTPVNRVWKQAAAFQDSPAGGAPAPSLMTDVFRPSAGAGDSTWWRKRMNLYNRRSSAPPADPSQLPGFIEALEHGTADAALLKQAALFCIAHPATGGPLSPVSTGFPGSPSPFSSSRPGAGRGTSDVWTDEKVFSRFFGALKRFLTPERDEELLQLGLIVLWEMMEHLPVLMEDRESDVFAILFTVRYSDKQSVLGSTNVIRDALCQRVDPIYGLTTMHASLLVFLSDAPPPSSSAEAKMTTYAFGMIALGKFILRLPDEILEEELPRLKGTLISALNETDWLVVREAAASAIIAAQLVLHDETHLFALLDGLADDKKNLLTYLFEKHSARATIGPASTGAEKLEKEMRRLDGRTSTPPRASLGGR